MKRGEEEYCLLPKLTLDYCEETNVDLEDIGPYVNLTVLYDKMEVEFTKMGALAERRCSH